MPVTSTFRAFSRPAIVCLLLAAATVAVYLPVVHCDFVNYDDPDYFTANPHVLTGLTPANAVWAFTTGFAGNWHPLTWLSLMLDAECFAPGPIGPHLTNLLLHTANTMLLFLLLHRLTGTVWRSALVTALFALHPAHVESVAWVAERKDVLSGFFWMPTLLAYARFVEASAVHSPRSKVFYVLSLLLFACGLMSKPMVVTLPFVLLLLDFWPLRRITDFKFQSSDLVRLIIEKIPFFALSAASCVVTFLVQQKSGAVTSLVQIPMTGRIENSFVSFARYLGKTFWPAALATPYPHPGHWPLPVTLLAFGLFAGLCAAAVGMRKKYPFAFTGWFWFAGMLVPVIGLLQVGDAALADRYTYLPLIGVFIILVWAAAEAAARWHLSGPSTAAASLLVLAAMSLCTRHQIGYWRNSGTLYTHALEVTKDNYTAENNLGTWLSANGEIAGAMDCFRRALAIQPQNAGSLFNLGNAFAKLGNWDEAINYYQHALEVAPPQADLLANLGVALEAKKQFPEAATNFEAALKLDPDSAYAHNNLAAILLMQHRYAEAAAHYREALRLKPDDPWIASNLGDALVRLGQIPDAVKCYQEALRLKPGDATIEARLRAVGAEVPK